MPVIASCYHPPRSQASASRFADTPSSRTIQGKSETGNECIHFSASSLSVPGREFRYNFTQVRLTALLKCERQHAKLSLVPRFFLGKFWWHDKRDGKIELHCLPGRDAPMGLSLAGSHSNADKHSLTIFYSTPKISYFVKSNQFEICLINFGIIFPK